MPLISSIVAVKIIKSKQSFSDLLELRFKRKWTQIDADVGAAFPLERYANPQGTQINQHSKIYL